MATDEITEALAPLASALAADGYQLEVHQPAPGQVRLDVRATDNACADCLVPRDLFAAMATDRLAGVGAGPWSVDVHYPADQPQH